MVRGPATLRYGSQAIGGVVNAINNRIPEVVPPNGIAVETRGGLSSVDKGATALQSSRRARATSSSTPTPSRRSANDYRIPGAGARPTPASTATAIRSAAPSCSRTALSASPTRTSTAPTSFPAIEAAERKNHIALEQNKVHRAGRVARQRQGIEAIRFWFGYTDYKHDERGPRCRSSRSARRFLQQQYEARMEVQHQPVRTALGELRGAVGVQWSDRDLQGSRRRRHPARPDAARDSVAGFLFEELQLTKRLRFQAAGRIESDEVEGTASTFPPSSCRRPRARPVPGQAQLHAQERQRRLPLRPAARRRGARDRRSTWSVRRTPPSSSTRAPTTRRSTFEIGTPGLTIEAGEHLRARLQAGQGRFPVRCLGLPHRTSRTSSSSASPAPSATTTSHSCGIGERARPDRLLAAGRHLLRRRAAERARHRPHLARRVGHRRAVRLRACHVQRRHATCRRCLRIGWAAASTIATSNWLARINLLHAFRAGRVRHIRHADARLQPAQCRAELHDQVRSPGRPWCPR